MKHFLIIAAVVLLLASAADAQQRDSRPRPRSITVSGEATISAEPDQAQIDIGVVTQARTAPEASKDNADRLSRARRSQKIPRQERRGQNQRLFIDTNLSVSPRRQTRIIGYNASNTVRIKTTSLDQVGRLIDAAMQAGANNINRLMFTLKDEQAAQLDALRAASAKAKVKAEAVAASLGLKIIAIAAVTEGERTVQPVFRQAMATLARRANAG